jgi:hypothetical protein
MPAFPRANPAARVLNFRTVDGTSPPPQGRQSHIDLGVPGRSRRLGAASPAILFPGALSVIDGQLPGAIDLVRRPGATGVRLAAPDGPASRHKEPDDSAAVGWLWTELWMDQWRILRGRG